MYVSFCYCLCFLWMETNEHRKCIFLFSSVFWWFLRCLLWCLSVACLFVVVNIWILFVCDWKLMSITFAYYRLARSTNGAKLTLCCFSHFWTAAQKIQFMAWKQNKNSHNELKIAYIQTRLKIRETHSETGP